MNNSLLSASVAAVLVFLTSSVVSGKSLKAPPGLFKDLNDEIVGDAIIINGKQLFIDDYIIEELKGTEKILNQPVKHPRNPLIVSDKPWDKNGFNRGAVLYDDEEHIYKMWYIGYSPDRRGQILCYAISRDGIKWQKPIINAKDGNNTVDVPVASNPHCVFKDPVETDPRRRYKMLYGDRSDGTAKTLSTNAAYSPDGIHWTAEPANPLIPLSDTLSCPYWDHRRRRYVAYLRYGPPNTRLISRIESEDFIHWSPKVTVIRRTKMDDPLATKHYGMRIMPYEGIYVGLLTAYHGETLKPIPKDRPWTDRKNLHLTFSRNGLTWLRVGKHGAIPHRELSGDRDWKREAIEAVFLPYGRCDKDWDWGTMHAFQPPLVVGDEIRIYYVGQNGRNWWTHSGDPPKRDPNARKPKKSIGLATLRLDGFVSINAEEEGTLTTKTLVFIGDTLEVNANAKGGSIVVEVLDANGKVIEGFSKKDSIPITTDSVRHVLKWKGKRDCHLIQAMPIKLRFYLEKAKLYSFTPRIGNKHYVPSYD
jgi:hypothetical protein